MVDFFYSLPIWLGGALVLILSLIIGLASSFGLRKAMGLRPTEEETGHAVSLMQVVAAYIGILVAFSGVLVWQEFADAGNAAHREAASAAQLYRDLATYGPETLPARAEVRAYLNSIVNDEWPLLAHAQSSPKTENALFRVYDAIGTIRPKDDRDATIYTQAFSNLNDLVGFRRDRLIHSESEMPIILWFVGLFGSILVVAYTATFQPTRTSFVMIAGISLTLGLVFLFILIVDRPYQGQFSVSNAELIQLSAKFDELDRLSKR
jgi:hypothetical protein